MRVLQSEVHRLSTDPADRLARVYSLLVLVELGTVSAVMVRSVSCWHGFVAMKKPRGLVAWALSGKECALNESFHNVFVILLHLTYITHI